MLVSLMATRTVLVLATVVSIRNKFFYPCCARCHKKVYSRDAEATILYCEECHEEYSAEKVEYRYRISVLASDRTQLAQITVFGSCLDKFFGTSATSLASFVNGLQFHSLPISGNHFLTQAVEQCFVGSLLYFGFRVCSSTRTTSQITCNSPFHLRNIVRKFNVSVERKNCHSEGLPGLQACQIFPCYSADQQAPTVLEILNENLLELHRNTPQSFILRSSQSQYLSLADCSQTESSCTASSATSYTPLQGNGQVSPIYCTPQEFCAMNTPLVLTGISQPFSGSTSTQDKSSRSKKIDHHCQVPKDQSDQLASQEEDISSNNSNSPRFTQLTSQRKGPNSSCEWTEYDDFPSSEDLSAFLADLEMDALYQAKEQTLPVINLNKSNRLKSCVKSDKKTSGEVLIPQVVTSQTVSFSDVVCGFVQEDYTKFTDFPSSEDLDAFLADMELDCENILQKTSLAPANAMRSADPFELRQNVQVSGTLANNEDNIKDIVKANNTKYSKNILDLTGGNGFYAQEDSVGPPCVSKRALNANKIVLNIELSDSELFGNCDTVFMELSEKSVRGKDIIGNKQRSDSSVDIHSSFMKNNQRKPTHCQEEIIKQGKLLCGLVSTNELPQEDIVCSTSLQHKETNIWSHDRDMNEAEIRKGSQSAASYQGIGSYSLGDESNNSLEMILTSPDLFSQSLSRARVVCPNTPYLHSSPRRFKCEHFSETPDLFSSPSCSRQEMNSVSLFSCSNHSRLSSSLSPLRLFPQPTSCPVSETNEHDASSAINHHESENKFVQNDLKSVSFHSTPCHASCPSKRLHRIWMPAGVSPLLADSRGTSPDNELEINASGTPLLFSQMSAGSF